MFWAAVSHACLARGGDVRFYFGLVSMPLLTFYFPSVRVFHALESLNILMMRLKRRSYLDMRGF